MKFFVDADTIRIHSGVFTPRLACLITVIIIVVIVIIVIILLADLLHCGVELRNTLAIITALFV